MYNVTKALALSICLFGAAGCQTQAQNQTQLNISVEPVSVIGGTGPYPATAATISGMTQNTLFLPAKMPNQKLPVVLWGNGGCMNNALDQAGFLREIASHGYLVIAAGLPIKEGKSSVEQARDKMIGKKDPIDSRINNDTSAQQLLDGLTWLTQVNQQDGNGLTGKIDTNKVAVMGRSCGGLLAIEVATDPRIDTAIIFNSGVIDNPGAIKSSGLPDAVKNTALRVGPQMRDKITIPHAYINGGPSDIAYFNALHDFESMTNVPVIFAENGVGHGGTFSDPNGGSYAVLAVNWLDWQLNGNAQAGKWFIGEDCLLCQDFDWQVKSKL